LIVFNSLRCAPRRFRGRKSKFFPLPHFCPQPPDFPIDFLPVLGEVAQGDGVVLHLVIENFCFKSAPVAH